MSRSRLARCRRHFRYRISIRFHIKRKIVLNLEMILMRKLFLGKLIIVKENKRSLMIWYPDLHEKCILIFDKKRNVFLTGYVGNRSYLVKHKVLKQGVCIPAC